MLLGATEVEVICNSCTPCFLSINLPDVRLILIPQASCSFPLQLYMLVGVPSRAPGCWSTLCISKICCSRLKGATMKRRCFTFSLTRDQSSITVSQKRWGQKGPLEVTLSNHPAQMGSPTASRPGQCPDSFWVPPRTETPQHPWATCAST